jgi:hypothetical protein
MTTFFGVLLPVLLMAELLMIMSPPGWRLVGPRRLLGLAGAILAVLLLTALTTESRAQDQSPTPMGLLPLPKTGIALTHVDSLATNNSTLIFASTATRPVISVFGFNAINTNATTAYLKFYNKATAPTCGTDIPKLVFQLPQNVPVTKAFLMGIPFDLGIGICIVANVISTDNTAATTGISVDIAHK